MQALALQQGLRDANMAMFRVLRVQCVLSCCFPSQQELRQGLPALDVRCA